MHSQSVYCSKMAGWMELLVVCTGVGVSQCSRHRRELETPALQVVHLEVKIAKYFYTGHYCDETA